MFCGFFAGFLKIIAPGWVSARFFCPRVRGFALSLRLGVRNLLFQKLPQGLPGGMVRLGIDLHRTGKVDGKVG